MYWSYLLKSSVTFTILYGFYFVFLRNITFHKANRTFLVLSVLVSILLPLIKVSQNSFVATFETTQLLNLDNYTQFYIDKTLPVNQSKTPWFSLIHVILFIYLAGIVIFSFEFIKGIYKIVHLRFSAKTLKKDNFTFILQNNNSVPYSFFKWIFISEAEYKNESSPIIEHEKIHSKQLHTLDIILAELFCIIFWFLPFVYAFKKSLRNIHEYLADQNFNNSTVLKINYLKLLSINTEKLIVNKIANSFYSKSIKNRIIMLTKPNSSRSNLLKFSIILPILFILVTAFGQLQDNSSLNSITNTSNSENPTFIYPIQDGEYKITSTFGKRMHPVKKKVMMHNAIDMAAKTGTEVNASAGGIIIRKEFKENGYGNVIAIQHTNGYVTVYAQLSAFKTEIGKKVKQGELIGLVGSTGMSTGPHLHFEIRKDDKFINPETLLK